ncbi:MAG: hypothetical protein M1817_001572 [Caeruleum heppii]|nr:MAG: hypothetical protein M1817_001572 [Caeruleum heppii]
MSEAVSTDKPSQTAEPSTNMASTSEPSKAVASVPPTATESTTETTKDVTPAAASTDAATAPSTLPKESEPVSESAAPAKTETKPMTEGTLGYKAPGLVSSFRFSKKFFWFGEEPVDVKHLSTYLRGEKPEIAHHNAAWSSETGKGLLYFSKYASERAIPAGIINLAEISELVKDGTTELHFKLHGQKHALQAASTSDRDSWLAALEARAEEAKLSTERVTGSSRYKDHRTKLVGTTSGSRSERSRTRKSTDKAPEAARASTSSSSSSDAEGKKGRKQKSRSVSRKRGSMFGNLLNKKEQHDEKKEVRKEEKAEEKAEPSTVKPTDTAVPAEKSTLEGKQTTTSTSKDNAFDATAVAARVVAAPVVPVVQNQDKATAEQPASTGVSVPATTTTAASEPTAVQPNTTTTTVSAKETPKANKRSSIFGSIFGKKDVTSPAEEKREGDVAPAVPIKDSVEPTSTPAKTDVAPESSTTPAIVTEPTSVPTSRAAPAAVTKDTTASSPKENFFGKLMKQDKAKQQQKQEGKTETKAVPVVEKPEVTPAAKEGVDEVPASTTTATDAVEAPKTEQSGAVRPAADPAKEKRRSSFFSGLGSKKDRVGSDVEGSEGETKQKTSPVPKFGGLFRKPSKAPKNGKEPATAASAEETAAPATTKQEVTPIPENTEATAPTAAEKETTTGTASKAPEKDTAESGAIGDVVPEAVTVGQTPAQQPASVQATA